MFSDSKSTGLTGKKASSGPVVPRKSPRALEDSMALSIMLAEWVKRGEECWGPDMETLNCSGDKSSCLRRCGVKIIILRVTGLRTAMGLRSERSRFTRRVRG